MRGFSLMACATGTVAEFSQKASKAIILKAARTQGTSWILVPPTVLNGGQY
jgi:hypothetical protein